MKTLDFILFILLLFFFFCDAKINNLPVLVIYNSKYNLYNLWFFNQFFFFGLFHWMSWTWKVFCLYAYDRDKCHACDVAVHNRFMNNLNVVQHFSNFRELYIFYGVFLCILCQNGLVSYCNIEDVCTLLIIKMKNILSLFVNI